MHIITVCPRCNQDFMYHASDSHLFRDETIVDEVGNNEIIETVICHDCCKKEVEKIIEESPREVYLMNANEVIDTRSPLIMDEVGHWNFPRPKMYSEEDVKNIAEDFAIGFAHWLNEEYSYYHGDGEYYDHVENRWYKLEELLEVYKNK